MDPTLSLTFRVIQSNFMSKIYSIHWNQVIFKNIVEPKNLKYGRNIKIILFTIDNESPKKSSQLRIFVANRIIKMTESWSYFKYKKALNGFVIIVNVFLRTFVLSIVNFWFSLFSPYFRKVMFTPHFVLKGKHRSGRPNEYVVWW